MRDRKIRKENVVEIDHLVYSVVPRHFSRAHIRRNRLARSRYYGLLYYGHVYERTLLL